MKNRKESICYKYLSKEVRLYIDVMLHDYQPSNPTSSIVEPLIPTSSDPVALVYPHIETPEQVNPPQDESSQQISAPKTHKKQWRSQLKTLVVHRWCISFSRWCAGLSHSTLSLVNYSANIAVVTTC